MTTNEPFRHPRWTAEGAPMDRVPAARVPHFEYDPSEPEQMELTVSPSRADWSRWTVADAERILTAEEARLHDAEDAD